MLRASSWCSVLLLGRRPSNPNLYLSTSCVALRGRQPLSTLLLSTLLSPQLGIPLPESFFYLFINDRLVWGSVCNYDYDADAQMQCSRAVGKILGSNSQYNNQLQHNQRMSPLFWERRVCLKGGGSERVIGSVWCQSESEIMISEQTTINDIYYQYHLRPFLIMRDRGIDCMNAGCWEPRERERRCQGAERRQWVGMIHNNAWSNLRQTIASVLVVDRVKHQRRRPTTTTTTTTTFWPTPHIHSITTKTELMTDDEANDDLLRYHG